MKNPPTRSQKIQRTQWAAQFLAASELVRRYYVVSFTMGNHTPIADLMVGTEKGEQFWVDVKGLSSNNAWLINKKDDHINLFYILVRVGETREQDRFFVLSQTQTNKLLKKSQLAHPTDPTSGFAFWPAPGSADTELGVLMEPEVCHGEAEVYTRVQA